MQATLPRLEFLPIHALLIHEQHDDQRTRPLILRMRASNVFRNPPIVSPLQDGTGRYMVLDGANRTTALQQMEFPHVLAQVVDPHDGGLNLQTWNHVIWEFNHERFLEKLAAIPELAMLPTVENDEQQASLQAGDSLVIVQTPTGQNFRLVAENANLHKRVSLLNEIVSSYLDQARLDRTNVRDIDFFTHIYPQLCGLVIFPVFEIDELLKLVGAGHLLPAGITRFTIAPRALHLNYPLEMLQANRSIEEKNLELQRWLQDRIAQKGVRYYAEPTFLFDE